MVTRCVVLNVKRVLRDCLAVGQAGGTWLHVVSF